MRPKVALIILLAGAAGLAGLFFLKQMMAARPQAAPVPIAQSAVPAPATSPAAPQISPVINISPVTNHAAPAAPVAIVPRIAAQTNTITVPDADYVQKKIDRLQELQAKDDDASLKEILAELTNASPVIRHEAVEATIQFGGHTAVPVLRDLAARTSDPDEKKELQDAADFLELPTLTEIRAQNPNVKIAPPPPTPVQP